MFAQKLLLEQLSNRTSFTTLVISSLEKMLGSAGGGKAGCDKVDAKGEGEES